MGWDETGPEIKITNSTAKTLRLYLEKIWYRKRKSLFWTLKFHFATSSWYQRPKFHQFYPGELQELSTLASITSFQYRRVGYRDSNVTTKEVTGSRYNNCWGITTILRRHPILTASFQTHIKKNLLSYPVEILKIIMIPKPNNSLHIPKSSTTSKLFFRLIAPLGCSLPSWRLIPLHQFGFR